MCSSDLGRGARSRDLHLSLGTENRGSRVVDLVLADRCVRVARGRLDSRRHTDAVADVRDGHFSGAVRGSLHGQPRHGTSQAARNLHAMVDHHCLFRFGTRSLAFTNLNFLA